MYIKKFNLKKYDSSPLSLIVKDCNLIKLKSQVCYLIQNSVISLIASDKFSSSLLIKKVNIHN